MDYSEKVFMLTKFTYANKTLQKKIEDAKEICEKNGFFINAKTPVDGGYCDIGQHPFYFKSKSGELTYIGLCHLVHMRDGSNFHYKLDQKTLDKKLTNRFCAFEFGWMDFEKLHKKFNMFDSNVGCPFYALETKEEFENFLHDLHPLVAQEEKEITKRQEKKGAFINQLMMEKKADGSFKWDEEKERKKAQLKRKLIEQWDKKY